METSASLSGWTSIDTTRFIGFTERVMSDIEIILQDFYKQPLVQSIACFGEDLRSHLYQSPAAHNLDLTPWHDRLIKQLYRTYKQAGYDGTIKDMLFSIDKVIDIAKHVDITAGFTTTKAVNAVEWKWLFTKHATERLSHYQQFDKLQPCEVINLYPGFSFSHFIKENFDDFMSKGYEIDSWNDREGTLLVDVHYDITDVTSQYINFVTLEFTTVSFILRISSSVGKRICQGVIVAKNTGVETIVFTTSLPVDPIGYTPILLVYSDRSLIVRDLLSNVSVVNPFPDAPYKLKLFKPLGEQGNCIREITYYPVAATEKQQLLFLK